MPTSNWIGWTITDPKAQIWLDDNPPQVKMKRPRWWWVCTHEVEVPNDCPQYAFGKTNYLLWDQTQETCRFINPWLRLWTPACRRAKDRIVWSRYAKNLKIWTGNTDEWYFPLCCHVYKCSYGRLPVIIRPLPSLRGSYTLETNVFVQNGTVLELVQSLCIFNVNPHWC